MKRLLGLVIIALVVLLVVIPNTFLAASKDTLVITMPVPERKVVATYDPPFLNEGDGFWVGVYDTLIG
ncbi:MAG: hypothetical protein J7L34_02960, partial [Thermotogaceae bacterium]|nr:hypothetical protein [Thermotogaceae bacterium]